MYCTSIHSMDPDVINSSSSCVSLSGAIRHIWTPPTSTRPVPAARRSSCDVVRSVVRCPLRSACASTILDASTTSPLVRFTSERTMQPYSQVDSEAELLTGSHGQPCSAVPGAPKAGGRWAPRRSRARGARCMPRRRRGREGGRLSSGPPAASRPAAPQRTAPCRRPAP